MQCGGINDPTNDRYTVGLARVEQSPEGMSGHGDELPQRVGKLNAFC